MNQPKRGNVRSAAQARTGSAPRRSRVRAEVRGYAEALVIAFLVVTFLFTTVGVVGSSMQPTLFGGQDHNHLLTSLLTGDRVFIPKFSTWLRRLGLQGPYAPGDVIVLREPTSSPDYPLKKAQGCVETIIIINRCRPFFIKRVIAAPDDTVSIRAGHVLINGAALDQSFITASGKVRLEPVQFPRVIARDGKPVALEIAFASLGNASYPILPTTERPTSFVALSDARVQQFYGNLLQHIVVPPDAPDGTPVLASFRVPADHYFVMGDNRNPNGSEDSRYFGAIPASSIAGQATAIIWPPLRNGNLNWRRLAPPSAFQLLPASPPPSNGAS